MLTASNTLDRPTPSTQKIASWAIIMKVVGRDNVAAAPIWLSPTHSTRSSLPCLDSAISDPSNTHIPFLIPQEPPPLIDWLRKARATTITPRLSSRYIRRRLLKTVLIRSVTIIFVLHVLLVDILRPSEQPLRCRVLPFMRTTTPEGADTLSARDPETILGNLGLTERWYSQQSRVDRAI